MNKRFGPDLEMRKWYDGVFPADHNAIFQTRIAELKRCEDSEYRAAVMQLCKYDPVRFINDWCVTFDPRNRSKGLPTLMPFTLYPIQEEFVYWVANLILNDGKNGVIDKSRDTGASWCCIAVSVWLLLFHGNLAIGWGSRKVDLVDNHGDPKTLFHKIRMILEYLPGWMKPDLKAMIDKKLLISNGDNGSSIVGEGGDNIGRGGRTTVYFKDESAFLENPIAVENALGENTDVQIDISTHNGTGTPFYQATRNYPKDQKFILDWSNIPGRDENWLAAKKKNYILKNNLSGFKQEILRDPSGGVTNTVIDSIWLDACIDAHIKLKIEPSGSNVFGFDVADDGDDRNSRCWKYGILVKDVREWETGTDITESSDDLFREGKSKGINVIKYDAVGCGAGCKGDFRKSNAELPSHKKIETLPFTGGAKVKNPRRFYEKAGQKTEKRNKDMFSNLKAQNWWRLRDQIHNTYLWVTYGIPCDPDEIISFSSGMENWNDIRDELLQPTYTKTGQDKILIDKKPKGAKSPNMADSIMIANSNLQKSELIIDHEIGGIF